MYINTYIYTDLIHIKKRGGRECQEQRGGGEQSSGNRRLNQYTNFPGYLRLNPHKGEKNMGSLQPISGIIAPKQTKRQRPNKETKAPFHSCNVVHTDTRTHATIIEG